MRVGRSRVAGLMRKKGGGVVCVVCSVWSVWTAWCWCRWVCGTKCLCVVRSLSAIEDSEC